MPQRSTFRQQSRRMALGGVMAALTVVILSLGSLVPLATFACPLLAMVCLIPLVCRYGPGAALTVYAGAGILSLFLCADKELAFLYAFLGWYPALRPRLEGLASKLLRTAVKCLLFSSSAWRPSRRISRSTPHLRQPASWPLEMSRSCSLTGRWGS